MASSLLRDVGDPAADAESPGLAAIQAQQALVIGIGVYAGEIRGLDNAPEDARAVANLLMKEYGFTPVPSGSPLLDEEASLAGIRSVVQTTLGAGNAATRWLFYFAGHGLVVDGKGVSPAL